MRNRKIVIAIVALLGAATLGSEAQAGGRRVTAGAQGEHSRGCRELVTLKHPDLKGPARKGEWSKCMADPDGYNR